MKTKKEIQSAIDEIKAVLKKHEVMLIGTCYSEGIFGEIAIQGLDTQTRKAWPIPENLNNAYEQETGEFYVNGIGESKI